MNGSCEILRSLPLRGYLLLLFTVSAVVAMPFGEKNRQSTNRREDLSFVHTFDTREMCMSRCRLQCSQHHSEDLMMPRWHCPLQDDDGSSPFDNDEVGVTFSTNMLLMTIPAVIFGSLLFLFICVSCTQRFFPGI